MDDAEEGLDIRLDPASEQAECKSHLPDRILRQIFDYVPMADLAAVAATCRAFKAMVDDETLWKWRWHRLGWKPMTCLPDPLLDAPVKARQPAPPARLTMPAAKPKAIDLLSDLEWDTPLSSALDSKVPLTSHVNAEERPYFARMQRAFYVLRPMVVSLLQAPSTSSCSLFTASDQLSEQCKLMCIVARFISPVVQGIPGPGMADDALIRAKFVQAMVYFDTQLRTAYTSEEARWVEAHASQDEKACMAAEKTMHQHAMTAWELRAVAHDLGPASDARPVLPHAAALRALGGSVIAEVHISTRPVLHARLPYNPCDALPQEATPVVRTEPLDEFAKHLKGVLREEFALIDRIFPAAQPVKICLLEVVVDSLVTDYVSTLLQQARGRSVEWYLNAYVQSLSSLLSMTDLPEDDVDRMRGVVMQVWRQSLEEYLDTEHTWLTQQLKRICDRWLGDLEMMVKEWHDESNVLSAPHSSAQKRSFLTTFKDAMLTPAVSMPRSASSGLSSLTSKWTGSSPAASSESLPPFSSPAEGYGGLQDTPATWEDEDEEPRTVSTSIPTPPPAADISVPMIITSKPMQMSSLLNLETAMELITVTRLTIQRLDNLRQAHTTFQARAQRAIIDAVVCLFASLNDAHMTPGFATAREQILTYDPAKHDQPKGRDAADHVGPLLLFFELVHIGDTIQQMMQVFFDRLGPSLLGKLDFTNAAVREKKRFENELDEQVAAGLNAGVELLVQQIEHIVFTHQNPLDFYPPTDAAFDVSQPTHACAECCATLRTYCDMLASCADKAILDVFYQEIGFRLYSYVCDALIAGSFVSI